MFLWILVLGAWSFCRPFPLELACPDSYRRLMKWIYVLSVSVVLWTTPILRAQDAATEERLNKLAGQIEDLRAGQDALGKRIEALGKDLESVRSAADKPACNYAGQDDLKRLAEAVKEVDRKRLEDYDK